LGIVVPDQAARAGDQWALPEIGYRLAWVLIRAKTRQRTLFPLVEID
jgi:hypothetical protein